MRKAGILAALLLLVPSVSQAKTLEELLVEKGVITKSEASTTTVENSSAKVYYNEGTRIEFPDVGFTAKINTLLTTRYTFSDNDEDFRRTDADFPGTYNGVNDTRLNRSSFDIQFARVMVSGTALYQEFAYRLEVDLVGNSNDLTQFTPNAYRNGDRRTPTMKDAWITWQPCEGYGTKMGQFRTYISRQANTDVGKLQLPDAAVVTQYNDLGRSQGIVQNASWFDGVVQAGAGIFNGLSDGEGENHSGIDTNHTGVVSLRVNPSGKMDVLDETDVNDTQDFSTSIGAAYAYTEVHRNFTGGVNRQEDGNLQHVSTDANIKYKGFSLHAEYYHQRGESEHSNVLDYQTNGGYVQAGFFILPKELEIAGRYGFLDCDSGTAPGMCAGLDNINEAMGAINYYWWKHSMKASLAYGFVNEDVVGSNSNTSDANTNRWLFQLSSYF
jgi:phosphate-selective porin OprO and OprP